MGNCQGLENRRGKILLLAEKYPRYHGGKVDLKAIENNENELWEHYQKFIQYKQAIKKSDPVLYNYFFSPEYNDEDDEISDNEFSFSNEQDETSQSENKNKSDLNLNKSQDKNKKDDDTKKEENQTNKFRLKNKKKKNKMVLNELKREDVERFYFFFNKANYNSLIAQNVKSNFPLFCKERFPKYKKQLDNSPLEELSLTSSELYLDDNPNYWNYLKNLKKLDLSFDKINNLPEHIGLLKNLKSISLRKNELNSLPQNFTNLKNLEEIDLSENHFTNLPNDIFTPKLKLLNLIGNYFETFSVENTDCGLERLFLAQNKFKVIPVELNQLKKLKYVNLDENLINEIPHNLDDKIKLDLTMSLYKNKGINQIKEFKKVSNIKNIMEDDMIKKELWSKLISKQNKKEMSDKNVKDNFQTIINQKLLFDITNKYKIKNAHSEIEKENNLIISKLEKFLKDNYSFSNDEKEKIFQLQLYAEFVNLIEEKIKTGKEDQINKVEDNDLRERLKDYYLTYLKKKEYEDTGKININDFNNEIEGDYFHEYVLNEDSNLMKRTSILNKISSMSIEPFIFLDKNIKQKNKRRDDNSNLIFLKELNNNICSSKVNLYLQYLSKIDSTIKDLIINLWVTRDTNSFILIITEFKLFIEQLINYYIQVGSNSSVVNYEVVRNQDKNVVIHKIFYNNNCLKILYRIGLNEKRKIIYNEIEQDYFDFNINPSMNKKHKLFENWLQRFITLLKQNKYDAMDLNL